MSGFFRQTAETFAKRQSEYGCRYYVPERGQYGAV